MTCAALTQAGTRADLSGDAVVDFQTTMDMPLMTVGNPGNAGELSGGSLPGGYGPNAIVGGVNYMYNIGKFEVTAGQYTEFLNAVAATDTYSLYNDYMDYDAYPDHGGCNIERSGSSGSYIYAVSADWEDRPVNFVSWGDAARFCNWLTNGMPTGIQGLTTTEDGSYFLNGATSHAALLAVTREQDARYIIPSEDEWYKAAYHANDGVTGNYFLYPTNGDVVLGNDVLDPDTGKNATFYDDGYTLGGPYHRTEVGEHENSESPYDTFDMGGNVWEWNETIVGESYRGLRGGSFNYIKQHQHASTRRYNGPPIEEMYFGFRIAEVPEPASVALLSLGSVALLRRRGDK